MTAKRFVMRQGKRIAIDILNPQPSKKKKRNKPFVAQWVKLPRQWAEALRQTKSANTYHLAHIILFEAFRCKGIGEEIVLSSKVTGLPRNSRTRAARELRDFGLITINHAGNGALRVHLTKAGKRNLT